ncbi:MAG: bifunctional (p)ppGpp synthetase/guanosine-3',5'-bis(diphosphate) 3'-pyrophosphohydrolase [Nitrospirae bacterium]|nr:bifunctional (p)ppGpp synthetase/guanosine-3',5'-bis(diphosphate) 3'-pyrophosphohydrolase [Nitrospirota bacterium]MBI3352914.1 bifunctional (p)ppGpp synthetase/guanosine-3',5'-bis(diphosphate) 3'-pyrophosphohydrolase [Nitrospirota bacterium]
MLRAGIQVQEIVDKVLEYSPKSDVALIKKAYERSLGAHQGQIRKSGKPYVEHPLEVALILTQLRLDVPSIVAGLLHDTVEDTTLTQEEVAQEFGAAVAYLVEGVTKIGKINFYSDEEKQAENFRKMLLSMSKDIRVILIKLADRLHNMRTLEFLPEEKQNRIARETLEIYAPLANRLGIGWMKGEFEDLCLRYLKPDIYFSLVKKIAKKKEDRDAFVKEVIESINKNLKENHFSAEVTGRSKHIFSIYQKMEKNGISFEEVFDLAAIRIITDTKFNCYAILGLIHSLWRPVPGRFKDYIGVPKSNLYQSLHTTVIGPRGERVEFQIRTAEMHQLAEEGIAAHWKYKEKGSFDEKNDAVFAWLRQLVEWQQDLSDNREFMNSVKMDLFTEEVYVFTPKGAVKELVKGSTPVDFAYSIHTEVGDHCAGAKVNGKIVPLRYELRNGDMVQIITSPTQLPNKDWLKWVKTPRAKTKIKHWISVEERKRSLEIGKKLLEKELRRNHLSPASILKADMFQTILKELGVLSLEELWVSLGYGRISPHQVIQKLLPEASFKEGLKDKLVQKLGMEKQGVKITGMNDILIHISKCCNAVPGDPIIGFITRGRGLSIHSVECPNIDELDYDKERIVDVDWETKTDSTYPVKISVLTVDKPGILASVSQAIASSEANITHAEITTSAENKKASLIFIIEIKNIQHLDRVFKNIEKVDSVVQVRRVRGS